MAVEVDVVVVWWVWKVQSRGRLIAGILSKTDRCNQHCKELDRSKHYPLDVEPHFGFARQLDSDVWVELQIVERRKLVQTRC